MDTAHIYLNVAHAMGYDVYQAISKRTWLAESVYAALLYPERSDAIERFFRKQASRNQVLKSVDFEVLVRQAKDATDAAIQKIDWQGVGLVGFSVCLCQLTSSLYAVRQIKKISPDIITLFGGSTVSNPFCRKYLDVFTDIDVIVNGEGELPLFRLLEHLEKYGSIETAHTIDGVVTRGSSDNEGHCFSQLPHLERLATPDYDDYFKTLDTFSPAKRFFPTLPVESSRGCWWKGDILEKQTKGCAFCNLNLQWSGYRQKDTRQGCSRHRCIDGTSPDPVRCIHGQRTAVQIVRRSFLRTGSPEQGSADVFRDPGVDTPEDPGQDAFGRHDRSSGGN